MTKQSLSEKLGQSDVKNTFELLGYDYMVTDQFEPKLIEINSNPCLEFACPLLKEIITSVFCKKIHGKNEDIFPIYDILSVNKFIDLFSLELSY
jgi:hypothetical protein